MEDLAQSAHPVLDVLNSRKSGIADEHILGLAIEGGGLRAALTAGMVAELHDLGYPASIFNIIVGSSAGAFNGAYYISGNAGEGARIYPDHMMQNGFVDRLGWLKRRPIMDTSLPVDMLLEERIPLDWDKIVSSQKLYIAVSDPHGVGTKVLRAPAD